MRIWKYKLEGTPGEPFEVRIPYDASIVSFGKDPAGGLCAWVMADGKVECPRLLLLMFTGQKVPPAPAFRQWKHRGTAVLGMFVWHLLEAVDG